MSYWPKGTAKLVLGLVFVAGLALGAFVVIFGLSLYVAMG